MLDQAENGTILAISIHSLNHQKDSTAVIRCQTSAVYQQNLLDTRTNL